MLRIKIIPSFLLPAGKQWRYVRKISHLEAKIILQINELFSIIGIWMHIAEF
jgi:hypothetical protein